MKLVTWSQDGAAPTLGALVDDDTVIVDLTAGAGGDARLRSMQDLIAGGPDALDVAREVEATRRTTLGRDAAHLHCPVPFPAQIRDCLCFEEHLVNSFAAARRMTGGGDDEGPDPYSLIPPVFFEQPIYYKANRFACIGTETDIEWPPYAERLDYELELACWIGRPGKDISEQDAGDHIFGYSVFNDVSARDAQLKEMPGQLGPAKGKDFDTGNILGPCIVTADAFDPHNAEMIVRVNGQEVARNSSSTATWSFEQVIAHISQSETLHAGEVLGSGTVGGGAGIERLEFLEPGDLMELEILGIGTLRNRIVRKT